MAISVILSSHGLFAQEALNAAKMIIGIPRFDIEVMSVTEGRTYEECLEDMQEKYLKLSNEGNEILILVDIFGGTPSNVASYLGLMHEHIQIFSGLNLPILLELLGKNPQTLEEAKNIVLMAQSQSLIDITTKMKEGNSNGNNVDSY